MPVAAVDIGTNSVRLLIADERGATLERLMEITRLGQDLDRTGSLSEAAIARTLAVLAHYGERIRHFGAARVRAAATSAARDAGNRGVFFDGAERALGVRPELLPGDEEARLSFSGATFGLDPREGPFLVVDIGGGSTEFVLGSTEPRALISVDVGCVRMTERYLKSDPPTASELAALNADVRQLLDDVARAVPVHEARCMIGLAGTITTLASLQLGLTRYDPTRTHHFVLTRADVERLSERLTRATIAERRQLLIEPKRAEVIAGGAAVLVTILREFELERVMVSETDILDGLAASLR